MGEGNAAGLPGQIMDRTVGRFESHQKENIAKIVNSPQIDRERERERKKEKKKTLGKEKDRSDIPLSICRIAARVIYLGMFRGLPVVRSDLPQRFAVGQRPMAIDQFGQFNNSNGRSSNRDKERWREIMTACRSRWQVRRPLIRISREKENRRLFRRSFSINSSVVHRALNQSVFFPQSKITCCFVLMSFQLTFFY